MANYLRLHLHLIWATKYRRPWLTHSVRRRLFPYMAATIRGQRGQVRAIGGWEDHVHIYAELPSYMALGQLINLVKARSTHWMRTELGNPRFRWQRGYAAFSVDPRHPHALLRYIRNQEYHHSRRRFTAELTSIVAAYGLDASREDFA
jgi:REP element-mobilizing transposase RayT